MNLTEGSFQRGRLLFSAEYEPVPVEDLSRMNGQ
jgi:hypothetical protein